MAGVAGLRSTADWGPDERPKSFRESILFRNPNGSAPIFALTSKAGSMSVSDPEFAWWDEPNDIVRLQVVGAYSATDTLFTVDSLDPDDTAAGSKRVYGKATNLKEGDVLLVEPVTDALAFTTELLKVTQVLSDSQFTVLRGQGGTTPATLVNDQWLTLIGSVYAEGTGIPRATIRNPVKYKNFTQIFKDTYELTGTADATETRTGPAWSVDKKRKMFKHSSDIEWSMMFGRPAETVGENGKPQRFMGGLRNFVGNVTIFGSPGVTAESFYNAIGPIWDYDTGAGDTRIMFTGRAGLTELQNIFDTQFSRFVSSGVTKVWGMDLTEFVTTDGRLLVKTHPLLSRHGLYKYSAFILDFDSIKYVSLRGRDTKVKDDVQAKDEDVRRGFIMSEISLRVDRGGLTMAYLGNIKKTIS